MVKRSKPPLREPEPPRQPYEFKAPPAEDFDKPIDYGAELAKIEAAEYTYEVAMAETKLVLAGSLTDRQWTPAKAAVELRAKLSKLLIEKHEHTGKDGAPILIVTGVDRD